MVLPDPDCELGYPVTQLQRILDAQQMNRLQLWMWGQTASICEGRRYDYETDEWTDTGCGPHGVVYYKHDVERWLNAHRIID